MLMGHLDLVLQNILLKIHKLQILEEQLYLNDFMYQLVLIHLLLRHPQKSLVEVRVKIYPGLLVEQWPANLPAAQLVALPLAKLAARVAARPAAPADKLEDSFP